MSRQPYIYTLPEQFMEDKSVPMRWKLYSLINGFWLSGKTVFASNSFFAEKLGCSERHIQNCLEDLEKEGVLERVGMSQNRTIVPKGTNTGFVGGRTGSSKGDEPGVHHNSDSNSDSKTVVADAPKLQRVKEEESEKPNKLPKDEKALSLCSWAEKRRGFVFTSIPAQLGAIGRAKKANISPTRLKERWIELEGETWRNGFDWIDVVKSFDKRA
jgi:hypothetical protein